MTPGAVHHHLRQIRARSRRRATVAWFDLRDAAGRWVFSEIEVCRIMGWSDPRLALRYAAIRGEDLSARLG